MYLYLYLYVSIVYLAIYLSLPSDTKYYTYLLNIIHAYTHCIHTTHIYDIHIGLYSTDQESLDEAEKQGSCPDILVLPPNHLIFAKDYIGWFFTAGHTFIHLTAVGRLESQVYSYVYY